MKWITQGDLATCDFEPRLHLLRKRENTIVNRTAVTILFLFSVPAFAADATCYGEVNDGAVEGTVRFPFKGPNFDFYSWPEGQRLRSYIHPDVADIMTDAFASLAVEFPDTKFLVGELGLQDGGELKGHKTHRNGTSVDLFFPIKNTADGRAVHYPSHSGNGYGYKMHFSALDGKASNGDGTEADFEALAEQLFQLSEAAKKRDRGIARVVLIKEHQWKLFSTKHGGYLQRKLRWLDDPADRHDQHVHIDFAIPCKPLREYIPLPR